MSIISEILSFVNTSEENVLRSILPTGKAAEGLLEGRPFTMLGELDAIPGLGKASILSLIRAADAVAEEQGWTPMNLKEEFPNLTVEEAGGLFQVYYNKEYYLNNREVCLRNFTRVIQRCVEEEWNTKKTFRYLEVSK